MIDVVFSDSACGSLKLAHYGPDGYRGGATIGVFAGITDGLKPAEEEIRKALQNAEEKLRLDLEKAVRLGGHPSDVFGFGLALSVGDISEDKPGEKRQQVLERMYSIYPSADWRDVVQDLIQRANEDLGTICDRISKGETVRIWYSDMPDEACGLYWFMSQLSKLDIHYQQIYLIKLPEWDIDDNECMIRKNSWGEASPSQWHRYVELQKPASKEFCMYCESHWRALQKENAPLRAMLNGQLVSVPEHIYDDFILREISAENEYFQEAMVIGRVLGKYRLGISDSWVAFRIEELIREGKLEVVSKAEEGSPIYHRLLKKTF
ncbi:MAG: DUF1835 domain-containing protein [Clostridiales bacterium]|nr:DUF1835 domain-containing protein [Clostridiales bacterium]